MDLLGSIRKQGSRGGVNFNWEDVKDSAHRESYLGHSLKAPRGRWQNGRDLGWYAKADDKPSVAGETEAETRERQRKEEIRRIKEAEEDAMARAMGLPVPERDVTGANAITVGEVNRVIKEETSREDEDENGATSFGGFVGKVEDDDHVRLHDEQRGGLIGGSSGGRREDQRQRGQRRDRGREEQMDRRRYRDERRQRGRSRSPATSNSTRYTERQRDRPTNSIRDSDSGTSRRAVHEGGNRYHSRSPGRRRERSRSTERPRRRSRSRDRRRYEAERSNRY